MMTKVPVGWVGTVSFEVGHHLRIPGRAPQCHAPSKPGAKVRRGPVYYSAKVLKY